MEGVAENIFGGKGILMENCAVLFGSKSACYEKNAKIQREIAEETIKFAAGNISQIKNGLWLDIGSGTGFVQKELSKNFGKINIVSLDISLLPLLQKENCVCGDFDNLAFADNSFDKIISCSALQWSKNIENALRNSFDALKTGGKLIIAIFENGTLEKLQFLQKKFGIKSLVSFYEQKYLDEILQKTGFEIIVKNERIFSQKFVCAYDALKSISKIGAANHGSTILSPKALKNFVAQYEKLFASGEIIHDYKTLFYISEKK